MLEPSDAAWRNQAAGVELDEFCRRAMANGLRYHQDHGRGLLPADLIEEINALAQPPIRWDVALAMWFDHHFPPLERHRSYARPSRRQDSTPDIPRPRHVPMPDAGQSAHVWRSSGHVWFDGPEFVGKGAGRDRELCDRARRSGGSRGFLRCGSL